MAIDITEARENRSSVKRNTRDSVFTLLFSDPKYQLQAYQALHPEDTTVTVDDIKELTLKYAFVNNEYNDLGICVRDKSLILIEAQATWSYNILVRLLVYYAATCTNYINSQSVSKYSGTKVSIPKPEFVVVYVGEPKELPEYISLSEIYFNGDNSYLELKAKVLQKSIGNDILSQYIDFAEAYRHMQKLYKGDRETIILHTIEYCKKSGILADFIHQHEREVFSMLEDLFDIEHERELLRLEEEKKNREAGLAAGRAEGRAEVIKAMHKSGMDSFKIASILNMSLVEIEDIINK